MARLTIENYPVPEGDWKAQDSVLTSLIQRSAELPDSQLLHRVIKWSVADGYACYLVVNTKPLTLQYIPVGDCYTVDPVLLRGLNLADVRSKVDWDIKWKRLAS